MLEWKQNKKKVQNLGSTANMDFTLTKTEEWPAMKSQESVADALFDSMDNQSQAAGALNGKS